MVGVTSELRFIVESGGKIPLEVIMLRVRASLKKGLMNSSFSSASISSKPERNACCM